MHASTPTLDASADLAALEHALRAAPPRLTPRALAQLLDVTPRTLANWRKAGKGPPYRALSPRKIRYEAAAVLAWLASLDAGNTTCAHCGARRPAPRLDATPAAEGRADA